MPRRPRKLKKHVPPPQPHFPEEEEEEEDERPLFNAVQVDVLGCSAANLDHADGEPATTITVARGSGIEPLVISMCDTRRLVTMLMVALASNHDEFAQKVLDDLFPADDDGNFHWPFQSDQH